MIKKDIILNQQLAEVTRWHHELPAPRSFSPKDFDECVSLQHFYNFELWHQEDQARDPNVSDSQIALVKRTIDRLNQSRNDTIEQLDAWILTELTNAAIIPAELATLNSETPGSLIDRLSINALKIYHMQEQVERQDVSTDHHQKCRHKHSILVEQRNDLGQCLEQLIEDLWQGHKFMKVYHQFKMYNDANLNPVLYQSKT